MEYDKLVENDIFPIPVGDEFGKNSNEINIVYSPLTDRAILVTHEYLDMMNSYMVQPENRELLPESITEVMNSLSDFENRKKPALLADDPNTYTRMAILPNNVCNFKCNYCYSAHGRSGKVIS